MALKQIVFFRVSLEEGIIFRARHSFLEFVQAREVVPKSGDLGTTESVIVVSTVP